MLTTHLNLGGIGVYVLSLAKGLVRRGHQVFVASSGGDLVAPLTSCGAVHLSVNINTKSEISPKVFFACAEIERIIKDEQIEIMHAHTRVAQVLTYLVSKRTNIPYVTTCHGFFKPRIFRRVFPCWGETCIAISEAVRAHLVNDFGVKKENIAVVHNGVEIERFSPDKFSRMEKDEFKKSYGLNSDSPVIGTVARLSPVKGQRYLILAMKNIVKAKPETQALLVGNGPEKGSLINQVKELGLEKNVFFSPSTLDTTIPLSIMDIFAFPSLIEGLGLAIIEAQAMSLPVVASDVGGIYTLVKEGSTGLLVRPKDAQTLAEAILKLLKNKNLAQELGARARDQVLNRFNLSKMIDGIEQVYKTVVRSFGSYNAPYGRIA